MLFFYLYLMIKKRCDWCVGDIQYENYHDQEWGVPCYEAQKLFEFLILETFQAGLSWITVLRKRPHFHRAFDQFQAAKMAVYAPKKKALLMEDPGIIRNRQKIEAAVRNAQAFLSLDEKYGFGNFLWDAVGGRPQTNSYKTISEIPPYTPVAEKLSKTLKKEGFAFVGPTVIYAFMQATGMVNDHLVSCYRYAEIKNNS